MAAIRHLSKAPVTEALFDFRVHAPHNATAASLENALKGREFGYEKKGPIIQGSVGFLINPQEVPIAQPMPGAVASIIGTRLHSSDEKYVAQFTTQGFTLSRLQPYETWDALLAEAKRLWPIYSQCVSPNAIVRVAARYINNLQLPLRPGDQFEKYLTELPKFPPEGPQLITSFLQRFVTRDSGSDATVILTQALEGYPPGGTVPVILDIDVFRYVSFAPDAPEVWTSLDQLRALKNRFFFSALTEEAVDLYQ